MAAGRRASAGGTGSAADFVPPRPTLRTLAAAAKGCRGCHLYQVGTQTVFGEGPAKARVMVVGEQPGDVEDQAGRPFVGPSGRLLDLALERAGIDREDVYVTNAVKHFKWERGERSARRVHKKPNAGEIRACRPWLEHEIALVKPAVILCLGATAAQALLGKDFRVTAQRARPVKSEWADAVFATVHPSAVLRTPRDQRAAAEEQFMRDLTTVARWMAKEGLLERADAKGSAREREVRPAAAREARRRGVTSRTPTAPSRSRRARARDSSPRA